MIRSIPTLLLIVCLPLVLFARGLPDDAKDLKSKDPEVRLAAVLRVVGEGADGAEKLLVRALKDKDWEVVTEAAKGLGRWGKAGSLNALVKLSWNGQVVPVREAAARSAAMLDPSKALKGLEKKMSGDRALRVAEAYAWVVDEAEEATLTESPKALVKLLKSKDTLTRAAAARALVLTSNKERVERLTNLFSSEYAAVVASALDAAAASPRTDQVEILTTMLERPELIDVLERRALRALVASVGESSAESAALLHSLIVRFAGSEQPAVASRSARLCEVASSQSWFDSKPVADSLAKALGSTDPSSRAAAARGLRFAPTEQALVLLRKLAEEDSSSRVRRAAVASVLTLAEIADAEQLAWVVQRLADEAAPEVREDLAVALGVEGLEGATAALTQALADPDWGVAVCAAVSLGRVRDEAGISPLAALTQEADWRLRGAAAVGLCHSMRSKAIAPLIELLADPEPLVVRTAFAFLRTINSSAPQQVDVDVWRTWWIENKQRVKLITPKEAAERREKYGYSVSPSELYAGLDVMVFKSDGDHIETVFDFLGIKYRETSSNRVPEDSLDAAGVFVSNCTGTMQSTDVERLQWFTKSGGYLFGSCWALQETIVRVAPGAVAKLDTPGEVLDQVTATACDPSSPYLKGVFGPGVVPIYHLVGAYLIKVLEPERVEVLVDSPECAERWGGGNLAVWYRTGHGRILDSVNHFEAQGLAEATSLKTPEDRMAYAIDHMGISLEKIRETRAEKWWGSNGKAAKEIRDLSVFTLITNFVRARRIESY